MPELLKTEPDSVEYLRSRTGSEDPLRRHYSFRQKATMEPGPRELNSKLVRIWLEKLSRIFKKYRRYNKRYAFEGIRASSSRQQHRQCPKSVKTNRRYQDLSRSFERQRSVGRAQLFNEIINKLRGNKLPKSPLNCSNSRLYPSTTKHYLPKHTDITQNTSGYQSMDQKLQTRPSLRVVQQGIKALRMQLESMCKFSQQVSKQSQLLETDYTFRKQQLFSKDQLHPIQPFCATLEGSQRKDYVLTSVKLTPDSVQGSRRHYLMSNDLR